MTKVNLKIDEMLFRLVRDRVAGSGITTKGYMRNALEQALASQAEEIRRWRDTKLFPLSQPMPNPDDDPLAELEENPGGGVRLKGEDDDHEHPHDLDDGIPF